MTVNPIPKYSEFSALAPVYPPSGDGVAHRPPRHAPTGHRAAVQTSHHGATAPSGRLSKSRRRWETGLRQN